MNFLEKPFYTLISKQLSFDLPASRIFRQITSEFPKLGSSDRWVLRELYYTYLRNKMLIDSMETSSFTCNRFNVTIYLTKGYEHLGNRKSKLISHLKKHFPIDLDLKNKLVTILSSDRLESNKIDFERLELNFSIDQYFLQNLRKIVRFDAIYKVLKRLHTFSPISLKYLNQDAESYFLRSNVTYKKSSIFKDSYNLDPNQSLQDLKLTKDKDYVIQDDGSRYIVNICNPKEENTILDYCAGAGGKSIALSHLTNNNAKIDAFDTSKERLKKLKERLRKLKYNNISVKSTNELKNDYDLVLVDAPCTGSGTIRRFPEKKYNTSRSLIRRFSKLQLEILINSSKFVKSGGKLVYSTCSVFKEENQDVVNEFLQKGDFKPLSIKDNINNSDLKKIISTDSHQINLLPLDYDGDCFFVAQFLKLT